MRTEYKGCGIYYNQLGEGREVILLHGWGYDSSLLMPLAQFLSAFCRVTLIDLPGHGQSDQPIEPMDIYDFGGAVKCVMDEADILTGGALFWLCLGIMASALKNWCSATARA